MPPENYSFLDVAVLDAVRQRFAAGDAIVILSADLEQVIWANGPGAAVFGYPDIETIIGASAQLPLIAKRQRFSGDRQRSRHHGQAGDRHDQPRRRFPGQRRDHAGR